MPLEYDDITPTDEQAAILDAFEAGKHLAVIALAATGKSSTLRMCGEMVRRRRGLYVAYNKAIKDEAAATFPMRVECRTMHSIAFKNMSRELTDRRDHARMPPWEVASKLGLTSLATSRVVFDKVRCAMFAQDMVRRFCHTSDEQVEIKHIPFIHGLESWVDEEGVFHPDEHVVLARQLLPYAEAIWRDINDPLGVFRFEHDHYLKIWALTHTKLNYDFLLLDEGQDLNGVMVGIVEDQDHMQLAIVGDANQQIYQWRGSLNAMDIFPVDQRLPLTQSWRFGPEIAAVANTYLETLGSEFMLSGHPDKTSMVGLLTSPDTVLCRTNAGGLRMTIEYQVGGRNVHFAGNRPREMLAFCRAVEKMQIGQIVRHQDLSAFANWDEVVSYSKASSDGEFTMMVRLIEQYGVMRLIGTLNALVPASAADLIVSTAHSAKGLEWNSVQLGKDWAPRRDELGNEVMPEEAETRLHYVAVTRARDELDVGPLAAELGLDDYSDIYEGP